MMGRLRPLLNKELRQVRRSRGALFSTTLLPVLLLVVTPGFQYFTLFVATPRDALRSAPPGAVPAELSGDPKVLFGHVLLPLFVALAGLVVPSVAATYTLVGERERRSLDLLVALPIRASDILWAKLLAILILAANVVLPMYVLDVVVYLALGVIDPGLAALLLLILLGALAYAVGEALLLALLARDLRTAQNLNGALLVPVVAVSTGLLFGLPMDVRFLGVSAFFLAGAAVAVTVGLRWLSFERYLL